MLRKKKGVQNAAFEQDDDTKRFTGVGDRFSTAALSDAGDNIRYSRYVETLSSNEE